MFSIYFPKKNLQVIVIVLNFLLYLLIKTQLKTFFYFEKTSSRLKKKIVLSQERILRFINNINWKKLMIFATKPKNLDLPAKIFFAPRIISDFFYDESIHYVST